MDQAASVLGTTRPMSFGLADARDALGFLWRNRAAALRLGIAPLLIILLLDAAIGALEAMTLLRNPVSRVPDLRPAYFRLAEGVLQLIIFLPTTVAWMRFAVLPNMVPTLVASFSFGATQRRFLGMQMTVLCALVAALGASTAVALGATRAAADGGIAILIAVGWIIAAAVTGLIVLMRISPVFVSIAVGRPIFIAQAWNATRGSGVPLSIAAALVALASNMALLPVYALSHAIGNFRVYVPQLASTLLQVAGACTELVFLFGTASLLSLHYKKLPRSAAPLDKTQPESAISDPRSHTQS